MIQLMHLFLTSMAEGIFCDFCADTTRTIAQKTTVNVSDSNILRLCIIMARKYTFFRPCSVIFHKGRDDASYSCVPLARCPRASSAHPTLRPNGLMWGYWDNVPLARGGVESGCYSWSRVGRICISQLSQDNRIHVSQTFYCMFSATLSNVH